VDAYPDRAFEGRVAAIYPKAEIRDNVVDYVVVVRFAPPRDQVLRPEMTASVRIVVARRPGVVAVPRRAVRRDGGRTFVLCREGGRVVQRTVRTGARDETQVEITEGLGGGEQVIVGDAGAAGTPRDGAGQADGSGPR
jgi:multidrug efflux pump subunit AcrA (membrane-fusion protein)